MRPHYLLGVSEATPPALFCLLSSGMINYNCLLSCWASGSTRLIDSIVTSKRRSENGYISKEHRLTLHQMSENQDKILELKGSRKGAGQENRLSSHQRSDTRFQKVFRCRAYYPPVTIYISLHYVQSSNSCHAPTFASASNMDLILAPPSRTNLHSSTTITTPATTSFSFAWANTLPADEIFRDFFKIIYP